MNDILQGTPPLKVLLLGLDLGEYDMDRSMEELSALCEANNMQAVASLVQKKDAPEAGTVLGEGKLAEAKLYCQNLGAEAAVFDGELTGSQIRNLCQALDVEVLDRTMLILEIFRSRATTNEGKLQTELALLRYRLPRLQGMGEALSRQGGGGGGGAGARRGAGESKLEYDRRHIRGRIQALEDRLKELEKRRGENRRARKKSGVPVISLVGYTNVGKSSLLNALCGAQVMEADMLFATLDPTARKLTLPSGLAVVLVDTVGFIRKLPHEVVEAFHATLEEARLADVLVLVSDGADPQLLSRRRTVGEVLDSLGATEAPRIDALNKCDLLSPSADALPGALPISAATGQGLDELLTAVEDALDAGTEEVSLLVPFARYALTDKLRRLGSVLSQEHTAEGVVLRWRAEKANVDYALREGAVLLETERK